MAENWRNSEFDSSAEDYSEAIACQAAIFETCKEHHRHQLQEDEMYARSLQEKFDAELAFAVGQNSSVFENDCSISGSSMRNSGIPASDSFFSTPTWTPELPSPSIVNLLTSSASDESIESLPSSDNSDSLFAPHRVRRHSSDRSWSSVEDDYESLQALGDTVGEVNTGLDSDEINRLPCRKYDLLRPESKTRAENDKCLICLGDWKNGECVRTIPCFHEFHQPCIDEWLKKKRSCPVCRLEVKV